MSTIELCKVERVTRGIESTTDESGEGIVMHLVRRHLDNSAVSMLGGVSVEEHPSADSIILRF